MRAVIAVAILAVLAGCGGDLSQPQPQAEAVTPSETEALPEVGTGPVLLSGQGIGWDSPQAQVRLEYGAPREELDLALTDFFGRPPEKTSLSDCGAGAMAFSRYPGGLTLNFQDDTLVGWLLDAASDQVELTNGIALGAPGAALQQRPGYAPIEDSTLGEEYYSEADRLGGFIEDGRIAILYAGTTCFFR